MSQITSPPDVLIAKLATRAELDDDDRAAIRSLACVARTVPAQNYLIREGDTPTHCAFLVSGFACRHKLTFDGARQIVGILVPGDFTDLQQLFLIESDHNVQTLTRVEAAEVAVADLKALALERPAIGHALWIDTLVEGSIMREALLNIGRRDGTTRVAHLLCEFETRLAAAGLADSGFELPMTQEQIGDATGLTSVHVNRTLKQLDQEGLIRRERRLLRIIDWRKLQTRADFDPRYLHLKQTRPIRDPRH